MKNQKISVAINRVDGVGFEVVSIEDGEVTSSDMFGETQEDLLEAVKEMFGAWRQILGENEARVWQVAWRRKNGWTRKWFLGTVNEIERKVAQLKYDRINFYSYDKMMAVEIKRITGHELVKLS